jgi:hypothetical protein
MCFLAEDQTYVIDMPRATCTIVHVALAHFL